MNKRIKWAILIIIFSIHLARAVEFQQDGKTLIPDKTTETIKIDGDLNENVWSNPSISEDFKEYYPVFGPPLGNITKVWLAYDKENLYFAFKCYDTEPNQVKTSIGARDKVYNDDWVGVILDTQGTRISTSEFYSNPSGIQWDGITTALNNVNTDIAPDFVYETAGKIVEDGYQVEMRIPLESIRFKGGKAVKMGIAFSRRVSRLGKTCMWPEYKAGQSQFTALTNVLYKDIRKSLNLEVLPSFTFSSVKARQNDEKWGKSQNSSALGISLKYGLTALITAEATVNPDFSQVESDAFQVEVTERYPIFYIEKRPFFMEGLGAFDFGYVQRGMMTTSLYTRYLADPTWATKLSGATGKMLFGVLAAGDKTPGQSLYDGYSQPEGKEALWGMARLKYNLGNDNAVGILYSGRYAAGNKNSVFGVDGQYRFFANSRFYLSYFYTGTKRQDEAGVKIGSGLTSMFEYNRPHLNAWLTYERYDEDFMMYSAFLTRKNISKVNSYFGPNFTPHFKFAPWIKRIQIYGRYSQMYDYATKLVDISFGTGFNFYFTRSGFFKIVLRDEKEAWLGKSYKYTYFYISGYFQLLKWLYLEGAYNPGGKIFYSETDPYKGKGRMFQFRTTVQVGDKLSMSLEFINTILHRTINNQKIKSFSEDIVNFNTAYQFNKYFFVRGALRYNSYNKILLTDFLGSFTLIPGTVLHLGYGSLYDSTVWRNNEWIYSNEKMRDMRNSFFFKFSYLWRIKK